VHGFAVGVVGIGAAGFGGFALASVNFVWIERIRNPGEPCPIRIRAASVSALA
jgi:hypothetical protein